ncbi:MAG: hypothetical protein WAQ10_08175, partial [Dethiobacteria bacterium]
MSNSSRTAGIQWPFRNRGGHAWPEYRLLAAAYYRVQQVQAGVCFRKDFLLQTQYFAAFRYGFGRLKSRTNTL